MSRVNATYTKYMARILTFDVSGQHDSSMFEQCYAVIATHCCAVLPPQELFGIAHFMEGRQHVHKAFDIAVQALKVTEKQETLRKFSIYRF